MATSKVIKKSKTKPSPEDIARGQRFRDARVGLKWTYARAAKTCRVDSSTLVRWETGAVTPPTDKLAAVATAYGCSASWLAYGIDSQESSDEYPAWAEFEAWLLEQPNLSAPSWLLTSLRNWRLPGGYVPTLQAYKNLYHALTRPNTFESQRAPRMAASG